MDMYLNFAGGQFSLCHRFNTKERSYAKRTNISVFTDGSRRRMLKYLRSSVSKYWVLGTLTYPCEFDARDFKQHWRTFVERWRRVYGNDSSNSIFWFVEFQRNGQPHIHFYANHYIEKGWIAIAWSSVVNSGNTKHEKVGTRIETLRDRDSALKYASKYAAKNEQKALPALYEGSKGFRWWGIVGNRDIVSATIRVDGTEYTAFELQDIVDLVKSVKNKVIFEDNGVTVWKIYNKRDYGLIFKAFKRGNKVLLQAEQKRESEIYRK